MVTSPPLDGHREDDLMFDIRAWRRDPEFLATIASAIIGGICISSFNIQPVSATGVILQETLHFANGLKAKDALQLHNITVTSQKSLEAA